MIENIRRSLYDWTSTQIGKKFAVQDPDLISNGLSPTINPPRSMIVRWMNPPPGRLKLNTDAAHGRHSAAGGAILRDSHGNFMGAISFHLSLTSLAIAEFQAAYFAYLYFATQWNAIDVEVDAQGVISDVQHSGSQHALIFRTLLVSASSELTHVPRDANQPAHFLAQYGQLHQHLTVFRSISQLPPLTRASYQTESTPHIRHGHSL